MSMKRIALLLSISILLFGCSSDNTDVPEEIELEDVTFEVLLFEFTPDTGNNSFRLQYEIRFTNPNNVSINGFHRVTINADGIVSSNIATDSSPCFTIAANSDCTISFDEEDSFDIARVNSIELVSVEYIFAN